MGNQKQQIISRFFAPKPNPNSSNPNPNLNSSNPKTPPPQIKTTVSWSPSKKRTLASEIAGKTQNSPTKFAGKHPEYTKTSTPLSKRTKLITPANPSSSLHQKFVEKLLETDSPATGNFTGNCPSGNQKYTPLEQQVVELKSRYPDVLLMVEVGYKFRFFGEDAEIAGRVLGIYAHNDHNFLTASIPTFRLNVHVRRLVSAGYKVGVVKQTETAAIKAHGGNKLGPFSRGLSALYTKATLEAAAEDMGGGELGDRSDGSNYLLCVVEKPLMVPNQECGLEGNFDTCVGLVAVEISTGDVMYGQFNDGFMRAGLESVLLSLSPAELLLGAPLSPQTEKLLLAFAGPTSNVRVEHTSRNCFNDGGALAEVLSLYENINKDNSIVEYREQDVDTLQKENQHSGVEGVMAMPELSVQALALAIRHLKQFGFERIICLGASFRPLSSNIEITLSSNTLQQLEVLKNNTDGSVKGSLLQSMNHTITAFGSRLLKHWVTHPLCDRHSILSRLDAVSEIAESMRACQSSQIVVDLDEEASHGAIVQVELSDLLSSVLTTLGSSPDIQRGIARIFHRTATPSEFIAVIHALLSAGKQLQRLRVENENNDTGGWKAVCSPLLRRLILTASSITVTGHAADLLSALKKDAAEQHDIQNLFVICNGQFPEVARGRTAVKVAEEKLGSLIGLYRKQLGIHNLEFISVSGSTHLIELPSNVRVPSNWAKVNSTKKMIRYHPPEVLSALDGLLLAKEELTVVCRATWNSFLMGFSNHYAEFQAAVQALAALDCLQSLAILSRNKAYVRPDFVAEDEPCQIEIRSGRHPVLESILQDGFVPNDTNLHVDGEYCQIVTGPNMGGKSCYIRQVALIAIMAQVGSFVPAASVKLHVLDRIFTRMGATDSIQHGSSTFFEELNEASHILHSCTSHSLVIIDELGRGTSTHDGIAIAYATLHHLLKQKKFMVLFVTHYPKIIDIKDEFPGSVGAYHVSYLTVQKTLELPDIMSDQCVENPVHGDITFLYTLVPGMSDKSFGLNVARLAQLPPSCICRAAVMAAKLEAEVNVRVESRFTGKLLLEKAVHHKEDVAVAGNLNMLEFSPIECKVGPSANEDAEDSEGLSKACYELFFHLESALNDSDPKSSLYSLKEAKGIALKMMPGK